MCSDFPDHFLFIYLFIPRLFPVAFTAFSTHFVYHFCSDECTCVQCFNCAKCLLIQFPFQFINYGLSTKYCYLPSIPIKSHPLVLKLFHGGNSLHFSCPLLFSEVIDCLITLPTWVPSFPYHYSGVWVT